LCNCWDAWKAQKNPGSRTDSPEAFDATSGESPEQILDRKFAADTLRYVAEQLRLSAPNAARFEALKCFLPGSALLLDSVAPVAASLGMTRTAVSVAVHHLRNDFKQRLTEAVADTLDVQLAEPEGKAEVEREMRLLYRTLCEPAKLDVYLQPG
jgi:hypothetical protein